jgi:Protein of unknown function (DUF3828)
MQNAVIHHLIRWFAVALLFAQSGAFAQDKSAEDFLRSIYSKAYIGKDAKGIDVSTRAKLDRYFVPELAKQMDDDGKVAAKHQEIGQLDGDPFIGAQDWLIQSFDVHVRDIDLMHAEGTVTFSNLGKPDKVIVSLRRLKVGWRIEDIDWGEGGKLSALFHSH